MQCRKFCSLISIKTSKKVYADYRMPQLFLSLGIFELQNEQVKSRIQNQELIPVNSIPEIALRAGSIVVAVKFREMLLEKFRASAKASDGATSTSTQKPLEKSISISNIDYFFWRTCVEKDTKKEAGFWPFHRSRGFCY